ncbi:MAG: hypothetical protein Q4D17_08060, partial [Planctomycetia bacterium]|nr:hypothetical protein [Planctomycetia bacterium]
ANLQLLQPPKPNQTSQFGDSFARDLIDALNSLLSAQNTFVESWIGFETCRMGIEISLGIFQLDGAGVWVDRGELNIMDSASITAPGSGNLTPAIRGTENAEPVTEVSSVPVPPGRSILANPRVGNQAR